MAVRVAPRIHPVDAEEPPSTEDLPSTASTKSRRSDAERSSLKRIRAAVVKLGEGHAKGLVAESHETPLVPRAPRTIPGSYKRAIEEPSSFLLSDTRSLAAATAAATSDSGRFDRMLDLCRQVRTKFAILSASSRNQIWGWKASEIIAACQALEARKAAIHARMMERPDADVHYFSRREEPEIWGSDYSFHIDPKKDGGTIYLVDPKVFAKGGFKHCRRPLVVFRDPKTGKAKVKPAVYGEVDHLKKTDTRPDEIREEYQCHKLFTDSPFFAQASHIIAVSRSEDTGERTVERTGIMMEAYQLGSLDRVIHDLDHMTALNIMGDLLEAAAEMEAKEFHHRDLKSANIYLHKPPTRDGSPRKIRAVVADFGLSTTLGTSFLWIAYLYST
jgi:serine/threonine protein kinase